ncbi:MAG: hypothetical protein QM784_30265 [Polyangiaceae bacterium]
MKSRAAGSDADDLQARVRDEYGKNGCAAADNSALSLCSNLRDKNDQGRDAGRLANISFAVAGVSAVATGLTYLLWPRTKASAAAFVVAPVAAPHAGGFSLQGKF